LWLIFTDFKFFVKIIYNHFFYEKNSGKTYVFSTIIVVEHNSINTNEFKYDEVKKLQNQKKVFSKESFIQVFIPDLAKLSLSVKITAWKKFCKLL